jgi:hypothetical protein
MKSLIDRVAAAILGGPAGDVDELEDARAAALDVLEVLAGLNVSREPYEAPRLISLGKMPCVELHLRRSRLRPGELSLGVRADSTTWTGVFELLADAGFQAGDVVALTKVPQ